MPSHNVALPVSSTNPSLMDSDGNEYDLTLDSDTFDRAGEDGDIPIIPLNGGSEWVGETPEGQWHKGWDANIDTFTATILGGTLRMTGVASVAGTGGSGWINSHHPAPLLDELEITVNLEVPIDDTGVTASRDIRNYFYLIQDKTETDPGLDNNYFAFNTWVDENGLLLRLIKSVNGATTIMASGFDYTMDTTRSTGNLEATIWRVVFNGKPGTTGATMSVYLKQAATLALAESATENEITGSPFDVSDWAFNVSYPAYRIYTENTTYFGASYDSANRAASTYLRVTYPSQFNVNYDFVESDYGKGEVELYDGDPDTTGVRVYDEDHTFSGDAYIQNSLIRLHIDELIQYGLKFFGYYGASWNQPVDMLYFRAVTSARDLTYPSLQRVTSVSPEQIVLVVRLRDSALENDDYYVDVTVTVNRGSYGIKISPTEVYPNQDLRFITEESTTTRFGYVGDDTIGDLDLVISDNNSTLSDNFLILFDNAGEAALFSISTDEKPTGGAMRFRTTGENVQIQDTAQADVTLTDFWIYISPFSNNSELFEEAEDGTTSGGATVVADGAASGGQAVLFDANGEAVRYEVTAGTDLPAGRYLGVFRARDTNQVANDFSYRVQNITDGGNRNEENTVVVTTLTASYAYYSLFFDITDTDVIGTDTIRIICAKNTAGANDIYVDYFLIVPIGDGENFPQDLSHSALRDITQHPRICER